MIFSLLEVTWLNEIRHYDLTLCELDLSISTRTVALFSIASSRGRFKLHILGFDLV